MQQPDTNLRQKDAESNPSQGYPWDVYRLGSLLAWQSARKLARAAYGMTLRNRFKHHYSLADQIRRAAASVPANIAEGYGLGTTSQLIRCLRISLGSAYELKCHVDLAVDVGIVSEPEAAPVLDECTQSIRLLVGLLKHLDSKVPH